MSGSRFALAVIDKTDRQVAATWVPGGQAEIDFVADCAGRISTKLQAHIKAGVDDNVDLATSKGVGLLRTTAHVAEDIRAALQEGMIPSSIIDSIVIKSIEETIFALKASVRPE